MKVYNNTKLQFSATDKLSQLGLNNLALDVAVFNLSKSNGINFNRIHLACASAYAPKDAKQKPTHNEVICNVCGTGLKKEDIGSSITIAGKTAVFSAGEIEQIKKQTDIIEILDIQRYEGGLDAHNLHGHYGLTIQAKSKTAGQDVMRIEELIVFLGEKLALIGRWGNRNSSHLVRIYACANYLIMQKLNYIEDAGVNEFLNLHNELVAGGGEINVSAIRTLQNIACGLADDYAQKKDLSDFHNETAQKIEALISARLEGKELPKVEQKPQVAGLGAIAEQIIARGGKK